MLNFKIKRGLNLPIAGSPTQEFPKSDTIDGIKSVALIGTDYVGLKPTFAVKPGDSVKEGQLLFTDKKTEGVRYTSPACGKVTAVNRGAKRCFQSIVVEVSGNDAETFTSYDASKLDSLDRKDVRDLLVTSGQWTCLRTRPFSKVPAIDSAPISIFVTAMDTSPLSANAEVIISERKDDFENGLKVLSRLTDGKVYLCKAPGTNIPAAGSEVAEFAGPHPAGLAGTHIHFVAPVNGSKTVWSVGYQDVIAIGALFTTGKLDLTRVISVAGPKANRPRLVKTRVGASLTDLTNGEIKGDDVRTISGSVLAGYNAKGPFAYLGRYHLQVSLIKEQMEREMFGWYMPGAGKFSIKNVVLSRLLPGKKLDLTTTTNGGHRAIVPIGSYEKVMPLDIMPTFLFRSIAVDDIEEAETLGALELDEEDLGLCTLVCPGKEDWGAALRRNLTIIEKEG